VILTYFAPVTFATETTESNGDSVAWLHVLNCFAYGNDRLRHFHDLRSLLPPPRDSLWEQGFSSDEDHSAYACASHSYESIVRLRYFWHRDSLDFKIPALVLTAAFIVLGICISLTNSNPPNTLIEQQWTISFVIHSILEAKNTVMMWTSVRKKEERRSWLVFAREWTMESILLRELPSSHHPIALDKIGHGHNSIDDSVYIYSSTGHMF